MNMKHDALRHRLKRLMIQEPMSYRKLHKAIGINERSLKDFMEGNRDSWITTLSRIERYLESREGKINDQNEHR